MFKLLENDITLEYYEENETKGKKMSKVETGIYEVEIIQKSPFGPQVLTLNKYKHKESLVEPSSDKYKQIYESCVNIFDADKQQIYKDLGTINKMGVLLYGPPGTGKTSLTTVLCEKLCHKFDCICLIVKEGHKLPYIIDSIRQLDIDRNIIIFIDEFDKIVANTSSAYINIRTFLSFLDGSDSRNNVLFMTCLNNYNIIPKEFKNRPSRFKITEEIDFCDVNLIDNYINNKIPDKYKDKLDVHKLSYKLSESKLTMDQIKTIIIEHVVNKTDIDNLIETYSSKKIVTEDDIFSS